MGPDTDIWMAQLVQESQMGSGSHRHGLSHPTRAIKMAQPLQESCTASTIAIQMAQPVYESHTG